MALDRLEITATPLTSRLGYRAIEGKGESQPLHYIAMNLVQSSHDTHGPINWCGILPFLLSSQEMPDELTKRIVPT